MALTTAVVLLLLACGSNAQNLGGLINQIVANKATEVDCLLGKPNCPSPPPASSASPPPPAGSAPPPAVNSPPPASNAPAPASNAPSPSSRQGPAPAPGPAAPLGVAIQTVALDNPSTTAYTAAQRRTLVNLLAAVVNGIGSETTSSQTGRKLLAIETLSLTISNLTDCDAALAQLFNYIESGQFQAAALQQAIVFTDAKLETLSCKGAGTSAYVAPSPSPAIQPVTPGTSTPAPAPATTPTPTATAAPNPTGAPTSSATPAPLTPAPAPIEAPAPVPTPTDTPLPSMTALPTSSPTNSPTGRH